VRTLVRVIRGVRDGHTCSPTECETNGEFLLRPEVDGDWAHKEDARASSDRRPFDKNTYFTWYTIFANVLPSAANTTKRRYHHTQYISTNLMAPLVRLPSLHVFSFEIPNQNQAAVFGDSGVWTSHGKYSGTSLLYCEKSIALYFSVSNSIARICTYKYSASSSAENTTKITRSNCTRHMHPISGEGVPAVSMG